MATFPKLPERSPQWSAEALAIARQAKVLSGSKLEQLVVRLQRHSGRPKEACWRFIIRYGIKEKQDHRRWTEAEFETVREELVKRSIEEVAKKINRSPKAIRNMLRRNHLSLREIRCGEQLTLHTLASAVHVRKTEVIFWIEQKWLRAQVVYEGKRRRYIITPEALKNFLRHHHDDLIKRGIRNLLRFEAYVEFCAAPKHTTGKHLLDERRDKRERAAFAEATKGGAAIDGEEEDDDDEDDIEDRYGIEMAEFNGRARNWENEES